MYDLGCYCTSMILSLIDSQPESVKAVAEYNETPESRELFEEVMKLPEKYRVVIHLFYYEDYSVKEIAKILRTTESSVKVRLSRGRAKLKDALKEEWEDEQ